MIRIVSPDGEENTCAPVVTAQVKIRVRLVSPSKKSVTAVWNHHLSWKVSEIRVVNTTDGSMSRFCGTSGWTELSAEPINMWSSSADQPDSQPVVTTVVEEIWENQRRRWAGYSAAARFPTDPPAFSDNAGMARYKESVTLPTAEEASILWTWLSEWEVSQLHNQPVIYRINGFASPSHD